MSGKITWYNIKEGFGFIFPEKPGNLRYFETPRRELFSVDQLVLYDEEVNPHNGREIAVHVKPAS